MKAVQRYQATATLVLFGPGAGEALHAQTIGDDWAGGAAVAIQAEAAGWAVHLADDASFFPGFEHGDLGGGKIRFAAAFGQQPFTIAAAGNQHDVAPSAPFDEGAGRDAFAGHVGAVAARADSTSLARAR